MANSDSFHPILGTGYYPLNDSALDIELADADIIEFNPMFREFTLIAGYRSKSSSPDAKTAQPFICIKNNTPASLHLFIVKEQS